MSLYIGVWLKMGHPHVPQKHLFNGVPLNVSGSYMLVVGISGTSNLDCFDSGHSLHTA